MLLALVEIGRGIWRSVGELYGSAHRRGCRCRRLHRAQRLLEVPEQVVEGLQTHGEANRAGSDTRGFQLFVAELPVGRAGRMNDQTLGIPYISQVPPEPQGFDESPPH